MQASKYKYTCIQGRNMVEAQKMEAEAIKLEEKGDVQPQGQDRFSSAEAYEQRLLSQLAGKFMLPACSLRLTLWFRTASRYKLLFDIFTY